MLKKVRVKLNVQIVLEALLLLIVTLGTLAYFSHRALHQEAMRNAEQMLEATVQDIDNILLGVEQSTGNIYYDMLEHLDNPDRMYTYSRSLVESNSNIVGCAIAFKPGYYPGKDLFMAYVHRKSSSAKGKSELVTSDTFADRPYTKQAWFSESMKTGKVGWIDPLKGDDTENEPLACFCLPFSDSHQVRAGVLAVYVSINRLSKIILAAKPSENGYSVLIANNGSYIVHPDNEKLRNPMIFSQHQLQASPQELEAAESMLAGESGMKEFERDGSDWCVFYKPFERVEWEGRSSGSMGWSVGLVYPESDIIGTHNVLLYLVAAIALVGLLIFFMLSRWIIRSQMRPLKHLEYSAQNIADGNYNEVIPTSDRQDEIGVLQNRFTKIQKSLRFKTEELEDEAKQLNHEGNMLSAAYDKAVEVDGIKASFLHYMTTQMSAPVEDIDSSVTSLCNNYRDLSKPEKEQHVDTIRRKSLKMVELLDLLSHFTENNARKEDRS